MQDLVSQGAVPRCCFCHGSHQERHRTYPMRDDIAAGNTVHGICILLCSEPTVNIHRRMLLVWHDKGSSCRGTWIIWSCSLSYAHGCSIMCRTASLTDLFWDETFDRIVSIEQTSVSSEENWFLILPLTYFVPGCKSHHGNRMGMNPIKTHQLRNPYWKKSLVLLFSWASDW